MNAEVELYSTDQQWQRTALFEHQIVKRPLRSFPDLDFLNE